MSTDSKRDQQAGRNADELRVEELLRQRSKRADSAWLAEADSEALKEQMSSQLSALEASQSNASDFSKTPSVWVQRAAVLAAAAIALFLLKPVWVSTDGGGKAVELSSFPVELALFDGGGRELGMGQVRSTGERVSSAWPRSMLFELSMDQPVHAHVLHLSETAVQRLLSLPAVAPQEFIGLQLPQRTGEREHLLFALSERPMLAPEGQSLEQLFEQVPLEPSAAAAFLRTKLGAQVTVRSWPTQD